MHGRLKVKTTAEKEAERNAEREKKKHLYQKGMSKIKDMFASGDRSVDLLNLMMKILENIPEMGTLWNWRRVILLDMFDKCSTAATPNGDNIADNDDATVDICTTAPKSKEELICSEKLFVSRCLEMNPKAYSLWLHRRWLVEQSPSADIIKEELGLCNLFLKYDERNFHCWDYRRYIVKLGKIPSPKELEVSTSLIERNFSNYSAWHYRSTLLDVGAEKTVREELEWTQNAYFTDPSDQSVWLYYQWLLGREKHADKLLSALVDPQNNTLHLLFNNMMYTSPSDVQIIDINYNSVSINNWTCAKTPSRIWSWSITSTEVVGVKWGEQAAVNINPICNMGIAECGPISPGTPLTAPPDIVSEQLANIRELYDLECDNKWVMLTLVNMIHVTTPHKTKEQISEIRNLTVKLCQVDPMRTGYYRDLWSKILCETAVTAWWNGVSRDMPRDIVTLPGDDVTSSSSQLLSWDPLNLSKMYLTKLAHSDYMFSLRELDISHNNIARLTGISSLVSVRKMDISHNKLTSLDGIELCRQLENLDASHNGMYNPATVLLCTKCRLHTLSLTGNPLTGSETYPGCVIESCPMLCKLDGKEL